MEPPKKTLRLSESERVPTDEEITEKDLPLLANVNEVRVQHYLMKLSTNFTTKIINGSVILFLDWLTPTTETSKIILDACYLNVKQVFSLETTERFKVTANLTEFNATGLRKNYYRSLNYKEWLKADEPANHHERLNFMVSKWSLTIDGWAKTKVPSVVRIDYETLENSPSIHWRPCEGFSYDNEDCGKCVYTPACPVNNRGLFPCQEPPTALATWEVLLDVENDYVPLLTSDDPGLVIEVGDNMLTHYFYTSIPLPMSTFSMVIGKYCLQSSLELRRENTPNYSCSSHGPFPCRYKDMIGNYQRSNEKVIPVRFFSLDQTSKPTVNLDKLAAFIFHCLQSCYDIIGPHPFSRLDLIIMPKCFPSLGLASPHMTFLSPSSFAGTDEPLFVGRIPHEICHSWFGLLIGALDWTEEWLSEGFATFYEDMVFEDTFQFYFPSKSSVDVKKEHGLKICLRLISLQSELQNTSSEFHVMSKKSENEKAAQNGLVPIKQFMHVHYYKGYLLLWHLSSLVGREEFLKFMREYVLQFHSQLVTSEIFLNSFYEKFKDSLNLTTSSKSESWTVKIKRDWLESSKLPPPYDNLNVLKDKPDKLRKVPLIAGVVENIDQIKKLFGRLRTGKASLEELERLSGSELMILLELVLSVAEQTETVKRCYEQFVSSTVFLQVKAQNPEILHRWCELIILCKDKSRIPILRHFLERNVAMGVYLYGELMISEEEHFQKLAKEIYFKMEGLYDMGTKRLLKEMLF